jgi:nitrate/TMAO reductase-like tetraheme cytochrome c subunit
MLKRVNLWFWDMMRLVGRNGITAFGGALTTISALLIIAFLILGLLGLYDTPYIGIMAFLVLPGVFVLGLVLIPAGLYWERKRALRRTASANPTAREPYPRIDFNRASVRRTAGIVSVLTVVNLLLISLTTYKGVTYMDSVEFCGTVCHTVMEPEYTAYLNSPHSRVKCVECHIGPGAPWFVRSKLSGVGQVFATAFNTYSRPIPTPVENLRPSRDTCEQCHWPEKFTGDRVKVITRFAEDEANTPLKTVLLMHIGGGTAGHGGIHSWHIAPNRQTVYIAADAQRQIIPWIQVREADGRVTEFVAQDTSVTPEHLARAERRVMDCIDCHNRPTHIFRLPDQAMDEALAAGRIDRTLPYIKKLGVEVLRAAADTAGDAADEIARRVRAFYEEKYPDLFRSHREAIEAAIRELHALYRRNVFPSMKVTWGTYPDNIGHTRFPGCFRCHDDQHVSRDGRTISQSCDLCHTLLAVDEPNPPILQQLNIRENATGTR